MLPLKPGTYIIQNVGNGKYIGPATGGYPRKIVSLPGGVPAAKVRLLHPAGPVLPL